MKKRQWQPYAIIALISLMISGTATGQNPIRIMPLGNSMTEGWMDGTESEGVRIAYRYQLKQLLTAAGYTIDFVGSKNYGYNYPGFTDTQNAGISGTRDQYLVTMLATGYDPRWGVQETPGLYLDAFNPDVILLSIGTNDITHEPDCIVNQQVSSILNQIDAYEIRAGKEVMVFLALIINRRLKPDGSQPLNFYSTHQWNLAIKSMAEQRIAGGDKIVIVNMEEEAGISYAYNGGDMCITDPEGLHPSTAGYTKMANLWYQRFISNYNAAPAIDPIPNQSVAEGGNFNTISLDNYVSDVEDADQYITWSATQLGASNLNISINSSRQATITPKDANWNGSQTVVFTATDRGRSGTNIKSDADTVIFTVTAQNDPPVITAQSALSVNEDNNIALSLSNFAVFDPDSDPSTFQLLVLSGSNYSVNGTIVTPAVNFSGSLNVNVAVKDNITQGPAYSAVITVNPINDPPVYTSQPTIAINEDASYIVDIQNFIVYDPDNTTAQLTFVMLAGANYTISGSVVSPDPNYNGLLYVESYIQDPSGAKSTTFYLEITVNSVNDPPVFSSVPVETVDPGEQYIYSIVVSDPDPGDVLTYTVPIKPSWITFYPNSKLIAGIPETSQSGNHPISINVSDGKVNATQSYVLVVTGLTANINPRTESMALYPNPASDHVVIDMDNRTEDLIFELFDLTGKPLLHQVFCPSCGATVHFNENNLAPGMYLYRITISEEVLQGRLMIRE